MQIENLKELQKLIKACRALGVEKIEIDGIKLELGALPNSSKRTSRVVAVAADAYDLDGIGPNTPVPQPDIIQTDALTPEQLMFYSSESVEPVEA